MKKRNRKIDIPIISDLIEAVGWLVYGIFKLIVRVFD